MFTKISDHHSHETRQNSDQNLYQYPTKTINGRQCIRHVLPDVINKTPQCITQKINTHSFNGFSIYTKNYMIKIYQEDYHIENCYICQIHE